MEGNIVKTMPGKAYTSLCIITAQEPCLAGTRNYFLFFIELKRNGINFIV